MLKSKRFLGIPVIAIVAVIIAVLIGTSGGIALSAFFFTHTESASVQIVGSDIKLYSDLACTIEIPTGSPLLFGSLNQDPAPPNKTANKVVYLKNLGSTALSPMISQTNLNASLSLNESVIGIVNGTPKALMIEAFIPGATQGSLAADVDAVTVNVQHNAGTPSASGGYLKFSDSSELLSYTSFTGATLNGIVRGVLGSTATAHTAGAAITWGQVSPPTLAPGAIRTITMWVQSVSALPIGTQSNFSITISAAPGV